jgi:glycerol-3-phosphate dehydrogenase (NAD(P)+)
VLQRATSVGVEMPITEAVVNLLDGRSKPFQAVALLMGRQAAGE